MALKDTWTDKVNGVDDVDAAHINEVANAVMDLEESALHTSALAVSEWVAEATANAKYHFKAFGYSADEAFVNVDFDVRLCVTNGTDSACFRYPCNMQRPFADIADGTAITRIIFRVPRIIFEEEDKKTLVTYFRAYEKEVDGARELWFEINTAEGYTVNEIYLAVVPKGGTLSNVGLEQKTYDPFVSVSGLDSLTIKSADWANKTTNLNISSRAAAPYATASGDDSRAEGEAGDVGGIGNTGSGKADFVRGEGNTNTGDDSIQSGKGNHNDGYSTIQVGNANKNYGGNAAQFGHTNENRSQHILQTGYYNKIPTGCDYASTIGTKLTASRRLQSLHGQYNAEDTRALAIWANGTADTPKNVFAIPESGTPTKDYDGVNLAFLQAMIAPCGKLNTPTLQASYDGVGYSVGVILESGSYPTDATYLFYCDGVLEQVGQKTSLDGIVGGTKVTAKVIAFGYLASDMSAEYEV